MPLPDKSPAQSNLLPWASLLALAVALVYANSFNGTFIFDDYPSIVKNDGLRDLTRPDLILGDYRNIPRPLTAISLAFDYAAFGIEPRGYHLQNFFIHLIATLALFGLLRRTLLLSKSTELSNAALPLAFSIALLWGVHPLQTQAVTYIVQRAESMMGMFFLLSLYCIARGATAERPRNWHIAAVAACLASAGCKQVAAGIPILALLYDRCFISGTFKQAIKRAPLLYVGLLCAWPLIGLTVWLMTLQYAGLTSVGANEKMPMLDYFRSQCVVLVHYLRLVFWPVGQCFDYRWPIETNYARIIPCAAVLLAMFGVTVWQLLRNHAAGFLGAWFFIILAPTSSFLPIADFAVEHRMYLPLAAPLVFFVLAVYKLSTALKIPAILPARCVLVVALLCSLPLGILAIQRNALYADFAALWGNALETSPNNKRALLAVARGAMGNRDFPAALQYINRAKIADPLDHEPVYMLGKYFAALNDHAAAAAAYEKSIALNPQASGAWLGLYNALNELKQKDKAFEALKKAADNASVRDPLQIYFCAELVRAGNSKEALRRFAVISKLPPDSTAIHAAFGNALGVTGLLKDAANEFEEVLRREPGNIEAQRNLAKLNEMIKQGTAAPNTD